MHIYVYIHTRMYMNMTMYACIYIYTYARMLVYALQHVYGHACVQVHVCLYAIRHVSLQSVGIPQSQLGRKPSCSYSRFGIQSEQSRPRYF